MDKTIETIHKIQKRSREGYYKINPSSASEKRKGSEKQSKAEVQKEMDRVKKLMNLYEGHDLKFDRLTQVKRSGTPVFDIPPQELPSPVAAKNSKNSAVLPFTAADSANEDEKGFKAKNFGF
jgi:hypothetical protein